MLFEDCWFGIGLKNNLYFISNAADWILLNVYFKL